MAIRSNVDEFFHNLMLECSRKFLFKSLEMNGDIDLEKCGKYIYSTNGHLIINIEDYNKGEEIGEIKKKTTNEWWFRNLYATKLDKGTKVYSGEMEYRKGDRPFQIVIEEDEEIVFIKLW